MSYGAPVYEDLSQQELIDLLRAKDEEISDLKREISDLEEAQS